MKHIQSALILLPNQLFNPDYFPKVDVVIVVEEPLLFGADTKYPLPMHKQKLILHRASMRQYVEEVLWAQDINVEYMELSQVEFTAQPLVRAQNLGAELVYIFDPTDHAIEQRYKKALETEIKTPFELRVEPNPSFMLRRGEVQEYFASKPKHKFSEFYQWQRERFNILIDEKYKPVGGKWSYDVADKKGLPKDHVVPGFASFGGNKYVDEAIKWVEKNFADNPGKSEEFFWPTSHADAKTWLQDFIEHRLEDFGPYEDAIDGAAVLQYHSGISAPLNVGLITPSEVIEAVLEHHAKKPVALPSLEGFIRQVIGWREYTRALYITQQVSLRATNELGHAKNLGSAWWSGETGVPPVDDVIAKVKTHAYAHNIERLMVVGNLMLLCETKPTEVYRWFMSMFIDSYDWVIVPNVYGMSQLNDLGSMVDKPYISGSDYILNMSHYERDLWCDIWDGLFWEFVDKNQKLLKANPRTSTMVKQLGKIDPDRRRIIAYRAQDFLANIAE